MKTEGKKVSGKKLLALALCLVMICTLLPSPALAETEKTESIVETVEETAEQEIPRLPAVEESEAQESPDQETGEQESIEEKAGEPYSELEMVSTPTERENPQDEEKAIGGETEEAESISVTEEEETADSTLSEETADEGDTVAETVPEAETEFTIDSDEAEIPEEENILSAIYINPLYADVITEEDLILDSDLDYLTTDEIVAGERYFESSEEATAYILSCLKKREEQIIFVFYSTSFTKETFRELFVPALRHTGVPTEGDYIRRQYEGWRANATQVGELYMITYTVTYFSTAEQENALDAAVMAVLNRLQLSGKSEYQKTFAIYRYIADNVIYDYPNLNDDSYTMKYTAYAALINGTAVCQGYATLLYRMLLSVGIDSRVISGTGNGGGHAWNIVRIGSRYYNVDNTWDAGKSRLVWFLLCDSDFGNHNRAEEYISESFYAAYPMSEENYMANVTDQTIVAEWSWDPSYTYATAIFRDEQTQDFLASVETTPEVEIIDADCTTTGKEIYTARAEYQGVVYTDVETVVIRAKGHTQDLVVLENEIKSTCTAEGSYDEVVYCKICGDEIYRIPRKIAKLPHTPGEAVTENLEEATCTAEGSYDLVSYCTVCGEEIRRETKVIEKLSHTPGVIVRRNEIDPTCTEDGHYDEVIHCSSCGEELNRETKTIKALGHYYVNDICIRCGEKKPIEFDDVADPSAYYYKAVYWAAGEGITSGTSSTTFSPGNNCTRGQIVTFLWKTMGSPEPNSTENPFTDVKMTDYFYKPVLWAKENSITSGKTATTFEPSSPCTRGQIVTFLWKAIGSPEPSTTENPFTDVKTSDYFYKPVLWAKENGVTSGTGAATFSPGKTCTRAQAMTFLWIASGRPEI